MVWDLPLYQMIYHVLCKIIIIESSKIWDIKNDTNDIFTFKSFPQEKHNTSPTVNSRCIRTLAVRNHGLAISMKKKERKNYSHLFVIHRDISVLGIRVRLRKIARTVAKTFSDSLFFFFYKKPSQFTLVTSPCYLKYLAKNNWEAERHL